MLSLQAAAQTIERNKVCCVRFLQCKILTFGESMHQDISEEEELSELYLAWKHLEVNLWFQFAQRFPAVCDSLLTS